MPHFIDILRTRAVWIFAACWVLILLAIAAAFLTSVGSSINVFYHPLHRDAPLQHFDRDASSIAIAILLAIGIVATILFWRKRRLSALATMVAGCAMLFAGLAVARYFVTPGPAHYVREIGSQRFNVPWQYQPDTRGQSDGTISIFVCLSDMRGAYEDNTCGSHQIRISSKSHAFRGNPDHHRWQEVKTQTRREQDRYGLEVFTYKSASEADQALAGTYFIGRNATGEMTRFVRCSDLACRHEALIGDYRLLYTTYISNLANWQETDRRIAALVDSWRAP